MLSEAILIFRKRKAAGYSSPICRCFLITNPGQTLRHPKETGKGVSKPNAVTAYQTCAFRICCLQMVRSSTLRFHMINRSREVFLFPRPLRGPCAALAAHFLCTGLCIKNACFQRNRHTKSRKVFLKGTELSSEVSP